MKKIISRIILGIVATGTVATASVITTTKIIENKKEENTMTKQVESTNIENQVENTLEPENIIENVVENSTENTVENIVQPEVKSTTPAVQSTPKATSAQLEQTQKVEQEKEISCTINIKQYAEYQHWREGEPQKIELQLDGVTIYQNANITDFNNNITVKAKGKGTKVLMLILNGGVVNARDINFDTQTSITINP